MTRYYALHSPYGCLTKSKEDTAYSFPTAEACEKWVNDDDWREPRKSRCDLEYIRANGIRINRIEDMRH